MRLLPIAACCLVAALFVATASAKADPETQIAQVKTATGAVFVVRDGSRMPIKAGDSIFEKDVIQTGPDGSVGMTFIDDTVMSAGPDSEVSLAEYEFDSSNFKGAMLTDMRRGTLTMVSGDIARSSPGAMKVQTPTAILGVRGTSFAIQVGGDR